MSDSLQLQRVWVLHIAVVVFVALFCVAGSFAYSPPKNTGFITDEAEVFSAEQEQEILQKIEDIQASTTAQIAIVTVDTTGEYDIFDAGIQTAKQWQIGSDQTDNGLLLFIAVEDRKWHFFTGYGLEGALPDVLVARIGRAHFPELFRQGQYAQGVLFSLDDIEKILQGDETIVAQYNSPDSSFSLISFLILLFAGFTVGVLVSFLPNPSYQRVQGASSAGFLASSLLPWVSFPMAMGGLFMFIIASTKPGKNGGDSLFGAVDILTMADSWSDGGGFSGGGFSGFGGGSFGGGGGGGSW